MKEKNEKEREDLKQKRESKEKRDGRRGEIYSYIDTTKTNNKIPGEIPKYIT